MKNEITMIQVGDVVVHSDCITEYFCCDLDVCKGECCIEGDAGAPVTISEIAEIEEALPLFEKDISPKANKVIKKQGVAYTDTDGDLVTSIVNGKDCVFTCYGNNGCCYCSIEKTKREGRTNCDKPISCYLYPIRVNSLKGGTIALNYHRWDICKPAILKGTKLQIPVYKFLREPLIKLLGESWYKELEDMVEELREQGYLKAE